MYSVANDVVDTMVVFPQDAKGNVAPMRELSTPHGTYGIAVDEAAQELYLSVQHSNSVVVYRKMASGEEKPIRTLAAADANRRPTRYCYRHKKQLALCESPWQCEERERSRLRDVPASLDYSVPSQGKR
jgi:hypothetical protein